MNDHNTLICKERCYKSSNLWINHNKLWVRYSISTWNCTINEWICSNDISKTYLVLSFIYGLDNLFDHYSDASVRRNSFSGFECDESRNQNRAKILVLAEEMDKCRQSYKNLFHYIIHTRSKGPVQINVFDQLC